ncbi:hypothetical protein D9M68_241410 [compost metagenome]
MRRQSFCFRAAHEHGLADDLHTQGSQRREGGGPQGGTRPQAETRVVPRAANLVIDHQTIGQRRTVVGTETVDRMEAIVHSHQQDRVAVDVAGEHASGWHTGQGHALGQVGTGGEGIGVSHDVTPLVSSIRLGRNRFARSATGRRWTRKGRRGALRAPRATTLGNTGRGKRLTSLLRGVPRSRPIQGDHLDRFRQFPCAQPTTTATTINAPATTRKPISTNAMLRRDSRSSEPSKCILTSSAGAISGCHLRRYAARMNLNNDKNWP